MGTSKPVATATDVPQEGSRFAPSLGADNKPFALALIRSIIAAANADGHIGADGYGHIGANGYGLIEDNGYGLIKDNGYGHIGANSP